MRPLDRRVNRPTSKSAGVSAAESLSGSRLRAACRTSDRTASGCSSVVEHHVANVMVVRSNRITRSSFPSEARRCLLRADRATDAIRFCRGALRARDARRSRGELGELGFPSEARRCLLRADRATDAIRFCRGALRARDARRSRGEGWDLRRKPGVADLGAVIGVRAECMIWSCALSAGGSPWD